MGIMHHLSAVQWTQPVVSNTVMTIAVTLCSICKHYARAFCP